MVPFLNWNKVCFSKRKIGMIKFSFKFAGSVSLLERLFKSDILYVPIIFFIGKGS